MPPPRVQHHASLLAKRVPRHEIPIAVIGRDVTVEALPIVVETLGDMRLIHTCIAHQRGNAHVIPDNGPAIKIHVCERAELRLHAFSSKI